MQKLNKKIVFQTLKALFTPLLLMATSFAGNLIADGWSTPAEERAIARVQTTGYLKIP